MAELKPCPFCGSRKLAVNGWCEQYWVTCSECETEGPSGETQTEAKEAWNRRATEWGMKSCEHHKEERKGKWLNEGDGDWRCSRCRSLYSFDDYGDMHPSDDYGCNFCPNCGADMRGTEDG